MSDEVLDIETLLLNSDIALFGDALWVRTKDNKQYLIQQGEFIELDGSKEKPFLDFDGDKNDSR